MTKDEARDEILRLLFEILQTRCGTGDICTCGRVTDRIEEIEQLATDHFGIKWNAAYRDSDPRGPHD